MGAEKISRQPATSAPARTVRPQVRNLDVPAPVEARDLSPADRLERLQGELRSATLLLQRVARKHGKRCDSPGEAEALADLAARGEIEPVLAHAVHLYQGALMRLRSEARR